MWQCTFRLRNARPSCTLHRLNVWHAAGNSSLCTHADLIAEQMLGIPLSIHIVRKFFYVMAIVSALAPLVLGNDVSRVSECEPKPLARDSIMNVHGTRVHADATSEYWMRDSSLGLVDRYSMYELIFRTHPSS